MHLKYRGIRYQASFPSERSEDSVQLGLFRRKKTQKAKPAKLALRKPGEELIYRGVRYTK